MVAHRIPKGDRPDIKGIKEEEEQKKDMVKLMQHCWHGEPSKRPDFNGMNRFLMLLRMLIDSLSFPAQYNI